MDETYPEVGDCIISYIIGHDSLKTASANERDSSLDCMLDVRLRMDGLFKQKEHGSQFVQEFIALYTNGPAGGGGIRFTIYFPFILIFSMLKIYNLEYGPGWADKCSWLSKHVLIETFCWCSHLKCSTGLKKEMVLQKELVWIIFHVQ